MFLDVLTMRDVIALLVITARTAHGGVQQAPDLVEHAFAVADAFALSSESRWATSERERRRTAAATGKTRNGR